MTKRQTIDGAVKLLWERRCPGGEGHVVRWPVVVAALAHECPVCVAWVLLACARVGEGTETRR